MKRYILLVFLISFVTIISAQKRSSKLKSSNIDLKETTWQTYQIVGLENVKDFYLVKNNQDDFCPDGCFLDFYKDYTFKSYNRHQCGNDCFIKLIGTFKVSGNFIVMKSKSVTYSEYCNKKDDLFLNIKKKYEVSPKQDTLFFKFVE